MCVCVCVDYARYPMVRGTSSYTLGQELVLALMLKPPSVNGMRLTGKLDDTCACLVCVVCMCRYS